MTEVPSTGPQREVSPVVPNTTLPVVDGMGNPIESPIPFDLLERARLAGTYYLSLIGELCGNELTDVRLLDKLDQPTQLRLRSIAASAEKHRQLQKQRFDLGGMSAETLLLQAFPDPRHQQLLFNIEDDNLDINSIVSGEHNNTDPREDARENRYHLREPTPGIYVMDVDIDLFSQLGPESQGRLSVKSEGVSLIMLRRWPKGKRSFNKRENAVNLPPLISSLVLDFARRDDLIKTTEVHPKMQRAYMDYQDKLLSTLCEEGSIRGYSRVANMSAEDMGILTNKYPNTISSVTQLFYLNGYLQETLEPLMKRIGGRNSDLILSVIESTSFAELRQKLEEMEQAYERLCTYKIGG